MHASGLAALIGHPDDEHTRIATFYGDPVAGFFASLRIVASLVAGRHGEHHEFAQLEGLLAVIPTPLRRASQGAPLERVPDKSPRRAPHGFFRCAGADTWIALSVRTDAEWAALRGLIDGLPVAPSLAERKAGEAAIDATLAAWTATRSPWDVTVALQGIGVPAFPVHSGDGLLKDAHLADRGFFRWVERPLTGGTPLPGVAFRVAGDGAAVRGYSPLLGEHSEEILTGELGLTAERVAELVAREVIR
jgi:crotonobetainyl-CoA:carnitine CoA-transferase CaiB-like acyl-CoA transferase